MIKLKSIIKYLFLTEEENYPLKREVDNFENYLKIQFPELEDLWIYLTCSGDALYLASIKIKKESRRQGIGRKVIQKIFEFADKNKLYVVLHPAPDARYKEKLDRFYKALGFVPNKGRHRNFQISSPLAKTMYRKPKINEVIIESNNLIEHTNEKYPLCGDIVDGRKVRDNIDNTSSISASLNHYFILKGIREIPMSEFNINPKHYSVEGTKRIQNLSQQINYTMEISPLIVVVDSEGPYILEGSHRIKALKILNAKSFPALVVVDTE